MSRPTQSLRTAINDKCRECIYDPMVSGAWREQVAACSSANCALHAVRPVPRNCLTAGGIDAAACHAVAEDLTERDARKATRAA